MLFIIHPTDFLKQNYGYDIYLTQKSQQPANITPDWVGTMVSMKSRAVSHRWHIIISIAFFERKLALVLSCPIATAVLHLTQGLSQGDVSSANKESASFSTIIS